MQKESFLRSERPAISTDFKFDAKSPVIQTGLFLFDKAYFGVYDKYVTCDQLALLYAAHRLKGEETQPKNHIERSNHVEDRVLQR
jgi:hypothetical protein